jgi:hypothetical protein
MTLLTVSEFPKIAIRIRTCGYWFLLTAFACADSGYVRVVDADSYYPPAFSPHRSKEELVVSRQ